MKPFTDQGGQFSGAIEHLQRLITRFFSRPPTPSATPSRRIDTVHREYPTYWAQHSRPLAGTVDAVQSIGSSAGGRQGCLEQMPLPAAPDNFADRADCLGGFVNYYRIYAGCAFHRRRFARPDGGLPWSRQTRRKIQSPDAEIP